MKYKFLCLAIPLLFLLKHSAHGQQNVKINFPSTETPTVFAPGIISDRFRNRDLALSPKNDLLFYTLQYKNGVFSTLLFSKKVNGSWTKPEVASFSGRFNDLEPFFSPDGKRLYFTSNRPMNDTATRSKDYDIWFVELSGKPSTWNPQNLGAIVNTDKDEFFPSLSKNGNLYFTRDNGDAKDDIFFAQKDKDGFVTPKALPKEINSAGYDFNAFIDPDENFLVFTSYGRKDDMGGGDLYISKKVDGAWRQAVHLDAPLNSKTIDYCPFISQNKKYFFFTSQRSTFSLPFKNRKSFTELKSIFASYGNGDEDIYIVDFKVLEKYLK